MKDTIALYNKKRSLFANTPVLIHPPVAGSIAIVIPASNEFPTIFETLSSIQFSLDKSEVINTSVGGGIFAIIVVNNKQTAPSEIKNNNQELITALKNPPDTAPFLLGKSCAPFTVQMHKKTEGMGAEIMQMHVETACMHEKTVQLHSSGALKVLVLDCASAGREMPEDQGVGWARKYGMDYALLCGADVIACMDADTLVSENYVSTLMRFQNDCRNAVVQKKAVPTGAVANFEHQKIADVKTQKAIIDYEFFIKDYSVCLKKTGTPHWPWALGPTLICSAQGYAASGGMNKRLAGEDFYFLQSLIKLHIQQRANNAGAKDFPILDCTVYPQARFSDRVLFGTGKKLQAIVSGDESVTLYPKIVYEKIERLLILFSQTCGNPTAFYTAVQENLPDVWDFLEKENFPPVWEKLHRQNCKSAPRLQASFHNWFDGLKILRLIHFLMG